jgi:hypothetical protein
MGVQEITLPIQNYTVADWLTVEHKVIIGLHKYTPTGVTMLLNYLEDTFQFAHINFLIETSCLGNWY